MMAIVMIVVTHTIKTLSTNLERTLFSDTHYFYSRDGFVTIIVDYCWNPFAVLKPCLYILHNEYRLAIDLHQKANSISTVQL